MTPIDQLHADLLQDLRQLCQANVYVGFSGGVDSTLLLALVCQALPPASVIAVHINHQLSPQADSWAHHCQQLADQLGCQYRVHKVVVQTQGQGIEAEARRQRYEIFQQTLPENALLLLGHHLDDQVETFFLRLLRGAGPHGLKSMAASSKRDQYQLARPLLQISRAQIFELATQLALHWIDDESNQAVKFDRNYLRHAVLPLIEQRWPGYRDCIGRTIAMLAAPVNDEVPANWQAELAQRLSHDRGLKLLQLEQFSPAQVLSLLHQWFVFLGIPVPSRQRLQSIVVEVIEARPDAQPAVNIGNGSVRRHGPALYWVPALPEVAEPPSLALDTWIDWSGVGQVRLINCAADQQPCLRADLSNLHWCTRQGGEVMRPYGRSKARDLKRLLQEYRIKPWLRERIPLLFSGDTLVAVGNELICAEHLAEQGEPGLCLQWRYPEISV